MAFSLGEYEMAMPVDWTDKVCFYLEAEDLLNLSLANIFWRNAVNRNSIWKPLCVKYFFVNPSEKPIIERKCRVEPAFKIVANSSPNLSNICSWRIRYAQEIYVLNNWIHQRYHAQVPSVDILYGLMLGNFLLFNSMVERTKCCIQNLNNGTIVHYNEVDEFYTFRNGFVVSYEDYFSYYAMKEDGFELKIQTVFEKALHPHIPLLADISSLQNHIKTHSFESSTENERFSILFHEMNSGTIVVWDFENLNTFSFDLSSFCPSAADPNQDYVLRIGDRESSILFLQFCDLTSNRVTLFILNIQNSMIVLLRQYHFENDFRAEIVGDSLALIRRDQIQLIESNGIIRNLNCSTVNSLINCRSFYCGLRYERSECYELFLIDKESFSIKTIRRYEGTNFKLECYLKCSRLDLVFVKDAISERTELINLKNLNIVEFEEDINTTTFESNKIIYKYLDLRFFW